MTCRLFIDEVGNDDVKHPSERYLSIVGIITKVHGYDTKITPEIEQLKRDLFHHDPPRHTVILHRKELVRKEYPFESLQDEAVNAEWECRILRLIAELPFIAIVVTIDKKAHVEKYPVWHFNPYHYCVRAILERYVLWLNRHKLTGDVVAEPRFKQVDKKLKKSFTYTYDHGSNDIPAAVFQRCLTSRELKFDAKNANNCGLQLVEMIANPSHQAMKARHIGQAMKATFGLKIVETLTKHRYARNPKSGAIDGWGQKLLP
jgi:Protein of unknown function (DUF3800)